MNIDELREAWEEAQACDTHDFYVKFYHLTGLDEEEVKRVFNEWGRTRPERVEEIAAKHGVSVREGGFQAFLMERFWPGDPEGQTLIKAARYLRFRGWNNDDVPANILQALKEGAKALEQVLDCRARLGHYPMNYIMIESPIEGQGDPRELRGDWPPEEDCPYCPTGRIGDFDSHKMSCSWAKGQSGRITTPVRLKEGL